MVRHLFLLATLLASCEITYAAAIAMVDRATIEANETFTLTLSSDQSRVEAPDVTVLESDFELLNVSTSSRSLIAGNGRVEQVKSFAYTLLPRRAGIIEIPPIALGADQTDSLQIEVREPTLDLDAGADVFLVAELDRDATWVQAQAVLNLRIYAAAAPRQPNLKPPGVSGAEVLVQSLGDDARYDAEIDGRRYDVFERRYALYPQQSGTIEIGAAEYSARLWESGRLSPRKVFRSEPLTLTVAPIPAPPSDYPNASWFPAESVRLAERWNPESLEVEAGEPLTREIEISAQGLLANQIPPLTLEDTVGLKVYPDQPELETTRTADGFTGFRTERFALIANQAEQVGVPPVELPWWDVNSAEWRIARMPGSQIAVSGVPEEPEFAVVAEPAEELEEVNQAASGPWRLVAWVFAGLWLATLALWAWTKRAATATPSQVPPVVRKTKYQQQRDCLRQAKKALKDGDDDSLVREITGWGRLQFGSRCNSLTQLATLLDSAGSKTFLDLDAARYGQGERPSDASVGAAINGLGSVKVASRGAANKATLAPLAP